jgi:type I restriction enzyme R subunit
MRNEADTRADLIDPRLNQAGWGSDALSKITREFAITDGRLMGGGRRSKKDIADYVLYYKNRIIGVVEAKSEELSASEGIAQAKRYAERLQVRYTFSTNGHELYQIDMQTGQEGTINAFPSPKDLWDKTYTTSSDWSDRFSEIPFEDRSGTWKPRYYQNNAIQNTLDAIARNKKRVLLTLATGTGKTAIAFQIVWKLFHAKWNLSYKPERRPRILFLADRNILANQAFNAFSAFDEDALVRIKPDEIRKRGRVPTNGSVFFTIFQTFMRSEDEDAEPYFGDYPEDFFDCIIVDECHRGGAKDESQWRAILEYFSPAVQIGLTATPKREHNADTYKYFEEPVYVYSLKEGINDGFLTPFKVKRHQTTLDNYTYTNDDVVIQGEVERGREYEEQDFNTSTGIFIEEREKKRIEVFLNNIDVQEKSLVFCKTQEHAAVIRDLINQTNASSDPFYCVRVTADDGEDGEQKLREFQDNEKSIPTILTTSQKLSTGVDARNIRHIVLLRDINSMIEFKQIVGRGTRLFDGKDYFTIHDFVGASRNFSDPEWDGDPEPEEEPETKGGSTRPRGPTQPPVERPEKVIIKLATGKEETIETMSQTSFFGPDGNIISVNEFLQNLYGELPEFFKDEDELIKIWGDPKTRKELLDRLSDKGFPKEQLEEVKKLIKAENSDLFDVLSFLAFETRAISREVRVEEHRDLIFSYYDDKKQAFLDFVLSQYVSEGVEQLDPDGKLSTLMEMKYGSIEDGVSELGKPSEIREFFIGFQKFLYSKLKSA